MLDSLFEHERIKTTQAKAWELRRVADRVVTFGKKGPRYSATPPRAKTAADVHVHVSVPFYWFLCDRCGAFCEGADAVPPFRWNLARCASRSTQSGAPVFSQHRPNGELGRHASGRVSRPRG